LAKKKHILEAAFDHDYQLIVIKTVLENFRLAYFLNKALQIQLKKYRFLLQFQHKKGAFDVFGYENEMNSAYWALIANKQIIEKETTDDAFSLFEQISNTFILIQEEKTVDYFLKIENNNTPITEIIQTLNSIHKVITAYEIDPNTLKSKDLLIF